MIVDSPERADATIPAPSRSGTSGQRGLALSILIPLLLLAVAGTLRFYRLAEPQRCYFDETYYYYQARDLREYGVEQRFVVHPPVGKWLIAGGLQLFGVGNGSPLDQAVVDEPGGCPVREQDENPPARAREVAEAFARRFAPALFGTLWVGVAYLAGLRLFRKRGTAAMAALLLSVEGLAFTMSRIAMLDVFLGFWVTVGFWLLLVDRDRQWALVPDTPPPTALRELPGQLRWPRWLAGVAFGLALATKWSAVLAIAAAGLFVLTSELAWRRRMVGTVTARLGHAVVSVAATLVLVPLVIYVASYGSWFANSESANPTQQPRQVSQVAGDWLGEQARIYRFHRDLAPDHPYRASAVTWPLMLRPVAYYWESCPPSGSDPGQDCEIPPGHVAEIAGLSNPMIWWMSLPAYLFVLVLAVRRRDWVAWAILAFAAFQYFPWLLSPRPVFLFYATPLVPFTCFALAYAAVKAGVGPRLRWVPVVVVALALIGFLFWYPVYTGMEISRAAWHLRMWLPTWI